MGAAEGAATGGQYEKSGRLVVAAGWVSLKRVIGAGVRGTRGEMAASGLGVERRGAVDTGRDDLAVEALAT